MAFIAYLLTIASFGLLIGALARLVHPGHEDMGVGLTVLVGLGGLVGAAVLTRVLWVRSGLLGLLFAVGVAALLVWAVEPPATRSGVG